MVETADLPAWPMFGLADDVRPALARARAGGRPVVLATITEVVGGSPRPVGSQMLIDDGEPHGYLSGGCIEADICAHAARVRQTDRAVRLVYGEGSPYGDIQLVCGGRIDVLLEPLAPDDPAVATLLALTASRREAVWMTDGRVRACHPADDPPRTAGRLSPLVQALCDPTVACAVLDQDAAFARRHPPSRRLVVVGGDPIALAIASLASQGGFETWLLRPKGPATPPPLPGVRYDHREIGAALEALALDRWTHVAVATHDLSADEPALAAALASPVPYVGALGARRRLPERLARLRALGIAERDLVKLHAPIGLDLGGKAPFEIAVSVLAEIIREDGVGAPRAWLRVQELAAAIA